MSVYIRRSDGSVAIDGEPVIPQVEPHAHDACEHIQELLQRAEAASLDWQREATASWRRISEVVEKREREAAELERWRLLDDGTGRVPPVPIRLSVTPAERARAAALRDFAADIRRALDDIGFTEEAETTTTTEEQT